MRNSLLIILSVLISSCGSVPGDFSFNEAPTGTAKAYIYEASSNTQAVFNEKKLLLEQGASDAEIRDYFSIRKTENGFTFCMPLMTSEKISKCVIVVREGNMEVAYLVQSLEELNVKTIPKWVDRAVTTAVELSKKNTSLRKSMMFDSDGMLNDKPLVEFTNDIVFPGQD